MCYFWLKFTWLGIFSSRLSPSALPCVPREALAFLFWVCPVECPSLLLIRSCNFPMVKMPSGMMSSNPEKRSEYFILHNPPDMWIQSECGFSHFAFQQSSSLPIFTLGLFVSLTYGCLLHSWCLMRGLEEREWGLWPWCWKWVTQAFFIQVISHTIIHTDFL